jgi:hypothetical protein
MSSSLGTSRIGQRDQPVAVCALVATLVVAGYLAYFRLMTTHLVPRLEGHWPQSRLGVLRFLIDVSPYVLLGVVLLLWGRTRRGRRAGALCAALAGLVDWGVQEAAERLYAHGVLSTTRINLLDWTLTLVIPTLVALGWGLARRSGRGWLVGVLVAPALAWTHRMLQLHSSRWQAWELDHGQWWVVRLELLAPMVAACLLCWLIDTRSSTSSEDVRPRPSRG